MKLCSQCEFIYEDDQERCDMDGAALVYEPTLEHVFPNNALPARIELEQRRPARLVIPLSRSLHRAIALQPVVANRSRLALQIGAGIILAVAGFAAFYATPHLFKTSAQTATKQVETQASKRETIYSSSAVSDASATADKPQTQNAKMKLSQLSDQPEPRQSKRETVPASNELKTTSAKRAPAVSPLPGLKPLPRLKPLPTLKPMPTLAERSGSVSASRKAIVVNTSHTKKDSRFGSFLKKTGRILTKPFKS